jgi:hypothetical protein
VKDAGFWAARSCCYCCRAWNGNLKVSCACIGELMRSRHAAAMGTSDCTGTRLGALETRMHCSRYKGSDGLAANGSRQRVTLEWTLVLVVVELSGARYQMPVRAPPHRPAATGCSFCGELGHGVKHRSSSMFADGGSHHLLFGLAIVFLVSQNATTNPLPFCIARGCVLLAVVPGRERCGRG